MREDRLTHCMGSGGNFAKGGKNGAPGGHSLSGQAALVQHSGKK